MAINKIRLTAALKGLFYGLSKRERVKLGEKLTIIFQEEFDKERVLEIIRKKIILDEANSLYSLMFAYYDSDYFVDDTFNPQIREWLEANLKGRFKIIDAPKIFVRIDFGSDKKAASLFKLFWM
jgi:hypothetical protein